MTSRKHFTFVDEPMGNKGVMAIPGIGPKFGAELRALNMHHAYQVYGVYLMLDRNEDSFNGWLTQRFRFMNVMHQRAIYQGLDDYCMRYLI